MFKVYAETGTSTILLVSFRTEQEAIEFYDSMHGVYIDENEMVWDLWIKQ